LLLPSGWLALAGFVLVAPLPLLLLPLLVVLVVVFFFELLLLLLPPLELPPLGAGSPYCIIGVTLRCIVM
jgi:hypothetical protein